MSINSYAYFEELYAGVKPIRGRSVEVRPIGKRHRDWEQIMRRFQPDGSASYAVRLHDTDVVEYYPNGDVVVRTKGWHTPSTAEFIHTHSPFTCWKQNNKLWVLAHETVYPIGDELRFKQVGEHKYEPAEPVVIHKKIVDREKSKAAREPLKPFMKWTKTFLKLSDGWVMHETCKEVFGWDGSDYKSTDGGSDYSPDPAMSIADVYEMLTRQVDIEPDASYLRALCVLAMRHSLQIDKRLAQRTEIPISNVGRNYTHHKTFYDVRVAYEDIRNTLHNWLRREGDVHQIVQVKPGPKAIHGAVQV